MAPSEFGFPRDQNIAQQQGRSAFGYFGPQHLIAVTDQPDIDGHTILGGIGAQASDQGFGRRTRQSHLTVRVAFDIRQDRHRQAVT